MSDAEFAAIEAEFLFSAERFNVTITRPQRKLILMVSRSLLDVVPTDERVFDAAQALRQFIFDCEYWQDFEVPAAEGRTIDVSVPPEGV